MADLQSRRIAAIDGDGIGPEVISTALDCLEVIRDATSLDLSWERLPWPSTQWHQEHGRMMPADGLEQLRGFDAILLGALGDPGPSTASERYRVPDSVSLAPLLEIRKGFDLFICERPAQLLQGATRYLADPRAAEVDMLVVRENSEGEYINQGGRLRQGSAEEVATQLEIFTRRGTERLLRHAFRRAEERAGERRLQGRPRRFDAACEAQVCLITKRNALAHAGELYSEVFAEVAADYPHIAVHHELVDAACMKFVQSPWQFDVVVASNLQGDILTDLAAVLCGGLALAPSCNINPGDPTATPMFEPTHGSAPDIAGQDRADPRAMLLTTAMMLDEWGHRNRAAHAAGDALRRAVELDLSTQAGSQRGTRKIGSDVAKLLRQQLQR